MIKEYFANYFLHMSNVTFYFSAIKMDVHNHHCDPWKVTLVDTGENTQTGGRLKRVQPYIGEEAFCFTYGDGVSDVNIRELVAFHEREKAVATVTAVQPPGRYGNLGIVGIRVTRFQEKTLGDGSWIIGIG